MKEVVEKPAETPLPNRKKRILVVEDESSARMFLLNQLKRAGLELDTAAIGGIALKKVKDGHYDAIIIDLMLGGDMKAEDLVKQIRKNQACANVLIFACANAHRPDPWRGRGAKNGVTKVFDKSSCTVEDVVGEIVGHLMPKPKDAPAAAGKVDEGHKKQAEPGPDIPETIFAPVGVGAEAKPPVAEPPSTPVPAPRQPPPLPRSPATPIPPPPLPRPPAAMTPPAPVARPIAATTPVATTPPAVTPAATTPAATPAPTPAAAAPAAPATAAAPAAATDPVPPTQREAKTGFFHNPTPPPRLTDTALVRKAAKAGQAAAAQATRPAMSGDTPLNIPLMDEPPPPKPPLPPPQVQTPSPPEPPKERGLAERIIAPFRIFTSSRSEASVHDLKEQLAEVTKNRDELLAMLRDHPIFGTPAPPGAAEGMADAKAAAIRAEAAYQSELARSKQFEEELKRIREARDELNRKLAEEEKAAAESTKRSKELEERLVQSTSELDEVKRELQKHIAEHTKLEGELRRQLNTTRESADIAKVAYQEQAALAVRSTEELAALQKAREELNSRLGAEMVAAAESRRRSEERERQLREKEGEVERLKAELARGSAQAELTEKLHAAEVAAQNAQTACKEEAARGTQFEQELGRLKQARDDMNTRLAQEEHAAAEARRRSEEMEKQLAAKTAELQRVKGELDKHSEERKGLESQLQQQLAAAKAAAEQARREFQQETTLFHRSKEEVETLRHARDELNGQLEREQQAAAESRRHSQELEAKLQASSQELTHLRAELEKHVHERATIVATSSRQLNTAKATAAKAEKAYQEQLKRTAKFEKELIALRQNRTPSESKAKTEQKSTAKWKRKVKELEERAAASAAELEKARKDFEKQLSERQRLESEHRKFAEASQEARTPESGGDPVSAEARFRESISALARATAQLEKEKTERRRIEQRSAFLSSQLENLHEELRKHLEMEKETQQRVAEFEQQLREHDDALAKAVTDLQKEAAARQLVEAQLKAKGEMGSQLQDQFDLLEQAKQVFNKAQQKLEGRLQDALTSLKQTQTKLQKQAADRKRLEAAVNAGERKLQDQAQQHATELARLQASVQVELIERRKVESQSLQSRFASVEASRLGRAFVNSFRTHLRPSAEHLVRASRRLHELATNEEHKKLVEQVLEEALILQTSMQDDARLPGEAEPGEAAKAA